MDQDDVGGFGVRVVLGESEGLLIQVAVDIRMFRGVAHGIV